MNGARLGRLAPRDFGGRGGNVRSHYFIHLLFCIGMHAQKNTSCNTTAAMQCNVIQVYFWIPPQTPHPHHYSNTTLPCLQPKQWDSPRWTAPSHAAAAARAPSSSAESLRRRAAPRGGGGRGGGERAPGRIVTAGGSSQTHRLAERGPVASSARGTRRGGAAR